MNKAMNKLCLILLLIFGLVAATTAQTNATASDGGILVGRIAHIEGKLLRYVQEEKDWVITVRDAPFGLEDTLYSEDDSKAELIMPNGTWIRTGENTQLQLIALHPDATTVDVGSGLARLYNKSNYAIIKVTTPFGYVVAPGNAVFDLYVGDESLEVIAVRGDLDFVHDRTGAKHRVKEGAASIIADRKNIALGNGTVDGQWDDWNNQRDRIWAKRLDLRGDSANYLPVPIREESYVLDEYGSWERVYYEGAYHRMWRPTRINPGWRPFTIGRWTVYYGDNCWIPAEPFGYVTHHYGSWIYVKPARAWYWAPPIVRAPAGVPAINMNFGWYPGRVGWIHSGSSTGWVPLYPTEVYYGHRPWGHRTTLITNRAVVNINISQYRYLNEAVIIPRNDFYRGTTYAPLVGKTIDRQTIINNYQPTTVINNTVIKNFDTDTRRFSYNDAKAVRKPHATVISRINTNQQLHQDPSRLGRQEIEQDLTRLNTATQPVPKAAALPPVLTPKLVDADKVAKPLQEMPLTPKEIKPKDRERQISVDNQPSNDRQPPSTRDQGRIDPNQDASGKDPDRRISPPALKEPGNIEAGQTTRERAPQREEQRRGPNDRGRIDPTPGTNFLDGVRRIESPRETSNQEAASDLNRVQQGRQQQELQQRQQQEAQARQQQEIQQRQQQEAQARQQQEIQQRQQQEAQARQQQEIQQSQQQETQTRQQQELQQRQQQEAQARQQQELQQRQQQEPQARQQQELQQRQQQEPQARQQQELQQRQQQEAQARQQQEIQQRQQQETQARQQQELQQRQQQEAQARQQQELQQRQQQEAQARQQQELQQRQQQEAQARQQQESQQRQQQEAQARQQQELQQRQQQEAQARQQQESQQRQQQEAQARQQQEIQQRQQQGTQARQQQEIQQRQQQGTQQQRKNKVPGQEQELPPQPTQNQ